RPSRFDAARWDGIVLPPSYSIILSHLAAPVLHKCPFRHLVTAVRKARICAGFDRRTWRRDSKEKQVLTNRPNSSLCPA
ncbi:hypothetical protein SERLA73DRAFT_186185, partial [Serpula lacrymans var. lacrymans S7.3]